MGVEKVRHWKDIYKRKVAKVNRLLDNEKRALQEKTAEFLNISKEADVSQTVRIRSVYEKKTKKSAGAIRSLQLKLDAYQSKLKQLELLEEENNKRKRNRCGSVDNINAKLEVPKERSSKKVSVTMPRNTRYRSAEFLHQNDEQLLKKCTPGRKKVADLLDGSVVSRQAFQLSAGSDEEDDDDAMMTGFEPTAGELAALISSVDAACTMHKELEDVVQELQEQVKQNGEEWRGLLEESRYHGEHLEEQINDMMELYQHEVLNLKQELSSLEEKLEYQMDERTRDLQDLVDACQTKITKLELQQQQSISMESLDGFSMKMFATKMANILLSFFAVGLISLSLIISFFKTFFQSRFMCLLSCFILILSMYLWHSLNYIRPSDTDELEDKVNYTS